MRSATLAAGVLALLLTLCLLPVTTSSDPAPVAGPASTPATSPIGPRLPAIEHGPERRQPASPVAAGSTTTRLIVGRLRWEDRDRPPPSDVDVRLFGERLVMGLQAEVAHEVRDLPAEAVTVTADRITIEAPHDRLYDSTSRNWYVVVSAPDHAPAVAPLPDLTSSGPDDPIDLGTIDLRRGRWVRGIVVDDEEEPVSRVVVRMLGPAQVLQQNNGRQLFHASTDADGRFAFWHPTPRDARRLVLDPSVRFAPDSVRAAPTELDADAELRLVVHRRHGLRGRFVDIVSGAPVPGARIVWREIDAPAAPVRGGAPSDMRGNFWLPHDARMPLQLGYRFDADATTHWLDEIHRDPDARPELRIPGLGEVVIDARSATDGSPVEQFGVLLYPSGRIFRTGIPADVLHVGRHRNGHIRLGPIPAGDYTARIKPTEDRFADSEPFEVRIRPGTVERVAVEVPRGLQLTVFVHTTEGAPAAGSRVELVRPNGHELRANTELHDGHCRPATGIAGSVPLLEDACESDESGIATFVCPDDGALRAIRVSGRHHLTAILPPFALRHDDVRIDCVLRAGARVSGVLEPLSAIPKNTRVILRNVHDPRLVLDDTDGGATEAFARGGTFGFDNVGVGRWQVLLRAPNFTLPQPVGEIEVASDADVEARFDVSSRTPHTVDGRVECEAGVVDCVTLLPDGASVHATAGYDATVDGSGRFSIDVPSGRYRVVTNRFDLAAGLRFWFSEPVEVAPGSANLGTLALRAHGLALRLTDTRGRPLAHTAISIRSRSWGPVDATTDGDGGIDLTDGPPEPFTLELPGRDVRVVDVPRQPGSPEPRELSIDLR